MPIHDWTRLEPGDFHHFHQRWIQGISAALNSGLLPPEYMALAEQVAGRAIPDVVALRAHPQQGDSGGVAVSTAPPTALVIARFEKINHAKRADRVVIRHGRESVVCIIEIVSPGNKDSRNAIRTFVEKAADILNQGVNLLVVDLFPPTPRDPQGIHKAIWDEFGDEPFEAPPDKPLTVASYIGSGGTSLRVLEETARLEELYGRGRVASDVPIVARLAESLLSRPITPIADALSVPDPPSGLDPVET